MNLSIPKLKKNLCNITNRGFASLAEVVLAAGIMVLILTIGIISFPRAQQSASINTVTETFLADFKEQQIKAMTGVTDGSQQALNYGIHFDSSSYTLFSGDWSASHPENFAINLPAPIEVTTTFDILGEKMIVFLKGNGEVASWNPSYSITFTDTQSNVERTIHVERSGAYILN